MRTVTYELTCSRCHVSRAGTFSEDAPPGTEAKALADWGMAHMHLDELLSYSGQAGSLTILDSPLTGRIEITAPTVALA